MPVGSVYVSRSEMVPFAAGPLSAAGLSVVSHLGDGVPSRRDIEQELAGVQGAVVTMSDYIDAEVLANAPRLRVIASMSASVDNIDLSAARDRDVVIANAPSVMNEVMADTAWALLLSAARRVIDADKHVRNGAYSQNAALSFSPLPVSGRTLAVIGMGELGQAVARRARGFGMPVVYTNRTEVDVPGVRNAEHVTVAEALQRGDFVVITADLGRDTYHLFNAEAFALMRRNAVLVNVTRGAIVDEYALVEALAHQRIAGAALDVFEREPSLAEGLTQLPNVVLSPHLGEVSEEASRQAIALCCRNVIAVLNGRPAPTSVGFGR